MAELKLISAESVTEGHPDKVCDQISDAILDDMLAQDPQSHVAVETCATVGQFFVFGEVTSEGYSEFRALCVLWCAISAIPVLALVLMRIHAA